MDWPDMITRVWTTAHLMALGFPELDPTAICVFERGSEAYLGVLFKMPDLSLMYTNEWCQIVETVMEEVAKLKPKLNLKPKKKRRPKL